VWQCSQEPWPFDRPSYLGSKLAVSVKTLAKQLSRECGTQAMLHSRGSPARYSFCMITQRNQLMPSVKNGPISANNEAVRDNARNRGWLERMDTVATGAHPKGPRKRLQSRRNGQLSVGVRGSSRLLSGIISKLESNQKRSSVNKGTREAQPSMAITRMSRRETVKSSPMRRLGGGVSVVVRGRESRPHGEGRQDSSCWMTEGFTNREASR